MTSNVQPSVNRMGFETLQSEYMQLLNRPEGGGSQRKKRNKKKKPSTAGSAAELSEAPTAAIDADSSADEEEDEEYARMMDSIRQQEDDLEKLAAEARARRQARSSDAHPSTGSSCDTSPLNTHRCAAPAPFPMPIAVGTHAALIPFGDPVGLPLSTSREPLKAASPPLPLAIANPTKYQPPCVPRFISWRGDWLCRCGAINELLSQCTDCETKRPCRDFCHGRCMVQRCRRPHLLFDLQSPPPPTNRHGFYAPSRRIARPHPGFLYRPCLEAEHAGEGKQQQGLKEGSGTRDGQRTPLRGASSLPPPPPLIDLAAPAKGGRDGRSGQEAELSELLQMLEFDKRAPTAAASDATSSASTSTAPPTPTPTPDRWPSIRDAAEEAEMAATLQASLLEQRSYSRASQSVGQRSRVHEEPKTEAVAGGLANETGDYNCFLNVVVQCLWHCRDFRSLVAGWTSAQLAGDASGVLGALRRLFEQLDDVRAAHASPLFGDGAEQPIQQQQLHAAIDPSPLRSALASLPSREFQCRGKADAAELLLSLYDCIQAATPASPSSPLEGGDTGRCVSSNGGVAGVDHVFGLHVREEVACHSCGTVTHASQFVQPLFTTQATAIRLLLQPHPAPSPGDGSAGNSDSLVAPVMRTGSVLRAIEAHLQKSCDTDAGGCGRLTAVTQTLLSAPSVFALQLAWEADRTGGAEVGATLAGIQEELDLRDVYTVVPGAAPDHDGSLGDTRCGSRQPVTPAPPSYMYRLASVVAYYGQHYQAFVRVPALDAWVLFDDAHVAVVGPWAAVVDKCVRGRVQPSILFYERVE